MKLADAIEIVLALARQNVIDHDDAATDEALEAERNRQMEAICTLEDFAVNHLGDE